MIKFGDGKNLSPLSQIPFLTNIGGKPHRLRKQTDPICLDAGEGAEPSWTNFFCPSFFLLNETRVEK